MKVLVTGATGFLGSHVVRVLLARSHSVRALVRHGRPRLALNDVVVEFAEGDLVDESSLRTACRGIDAIIHCAARIGYWSGIEDEQRAVNVEGSSKLMRAAQAAKVGRIVHVSSIATVGCIPVSEWSNGRRALDETHAWNPRALDIHYVTTKKESEERAFAAAWAGMDVVVVNPGMLVGPRLDGKPSSTLFRRIASRAIRWIPPGGTSVVDVEDAARGTVAALERGRSGERYILGGHNLEWSELYAAIARELGVRAPRRRMPMAFVIAMRSATSWLDAVRLSKPPWTPELFRSLGLCAFVNSDKARRELGYETRSLEEVLQRACRDVRR